MPPVSTGPLDFQVSLVGCRRDNRREGGVILTFKVDATGGNGIYTYVREGQNVAQISERPATKGSGVIDAWRVRSGDGQEAQRKYRFAGSELQLPLTSTARGRGTACPFPLRYAEWVSRQHAPARQGDRKGAPLQLTTRARTSVEASGAGVRTVAGQSANRAAAGHYGAVTATVTEARDR